MKYVALLRGINVGGKNKVPMGALKEVFEDVGHAEVRTYINSGNVVFDAPRTRVADLAEELEAAIEREFGFATRVLVLRGSAVTKIAAELPDDWVNDDHSSCNVLYLLPERASPKALDAFDLNPEHEEARYCAGAVLSRVDRSYVSRSALHKVIGTDLYAYVTIRNCNTARKLAAMVAEGFTVHGARTPV
jgi:uncharacterized protein (DUF1697 family)